MADDFCSPLVAAGSQADLGIQEEVCYGDLPNTPNMKTFLRTSTSLGLTKEAYESETIRSDRMTLDSRHGIRSVGGDVAVEIAPGVHEMAYEAVMGGVWTAPGDIDVGTNGVEVAQGTDGMVTLTLTGTDWLAEGYRLGDTVTFTGTGDADIDGKIFTIAAIDPAAPEAASCMPYNGWDTTAATKNLAAGTMSLKGAWVSMGNIYRSFLFERAFTDIGSFITYSGNRFNTMAVDLPPTGIATATFGLLGKDASPIKPASFDGVAEIVLDQTTLTSLTFDAAAGTITAGAGDFGTSGISPGDVILIQGPGLDAMHQNRNPRTVIAVNGAELTVAEAIESGVTAGDFTVTRVGLPDYMAAADAEVLVAVSGTLLLDGEPVGTVTAASLNVDNGMAGSNVVGSNTMPVMLWGNRAAISGSLTVLFDRGGIGEKVYNAFDQEKDMSLILRMDTASGEDFMEFVMPRIKINSGTIGDAVAEGLPVSADFVALLPTGDTAAISHPSQLTIYDSTVDAVAVAAAGGGAAAGAPAAAVAGAGTATVTVTLTGTAAGGETVTVTGLTGPTGPITGFAAPTINAGDDAAAMATAIAGALNGLQDASATDTINAAAAGGVITITEAGGGNVGLTGVTIA